MARAAAPVDRRQGQPRHVIFRPLIRLGPDGAVHAPRADIQAATDNQFRPSGPMILRPLSGICQPRTATSFNTPAHFRNTITQGYPMVRRPAKMRYLEMRKQGAGLWRRVMMITDRQGRVHALDNPDFSA